MNVDPAAQFSMGELIGRAVGLTCLGAFLGLLLAALPHAVWQGCGLLRLRRGAKRKFSFGLALIALGTATLIGAATGFTVGVARAALVVAREIGPKVFQTSAENTLRAAGVKDFTSFDPARLRELLEQAGKAELPALPGELAQRLRPEMELSRAKLLEQAKAWLDTQSKDGPLAVGGSGGDLLAEGVGRAGDVGAAFPGRGDHAWRPVDSRFGNHFGAVVCVVPRAAVAH